METFRAIILFGPPGSGKGTVGELLGEAGEQVHLSTGDMFRSLDPTSEVGKEVQEYLDAGKLVPDELTIRVWYQHVQELISSGKFDPKTQLLFLDGVPRSAAQVELLKPYLDLVCVVILEVPDKEILIDRIQLRGKAQGRSDDQSKEVLETRMRVYEEQTRDVIGHYPKELVRRVNGNQGRLQVMRDVLIEIADRV